MKSLVHTCVAFVAALTCCFVAQRAQAESVVDLELVLAVDVSLSMQMDEQQLQRDGYVEAFRDAALHKAIRSGNHGRIAVTYVEWAGAFIQSVVVPWRIISSAKDARAFADELATKPIRRARMTSISGAMQHGQRLMSENNITALRKVIDVSGDGPNNSGSHVEIARDEMIKAGIVVNGLPIMLQSVSQWGGYFEIANLDHYYSDCVVGGPGSFVLAVRKPSEFATAIRQKLLLEIAGLQPAAEARIIPAQFKPPRPKYDCLIGEKRWEEYLRDSE